MSSVNPRARDYETHDGLEVAKDIAMVIRWIWGIAAMFAVAIAWSVTLANDVKSNTEALEDTMSKEQIEEGFERILESLDEIKQNQKEDDKRQRAIKSQLDKLEAKVDEIENRVE